MKTIGLIVLLVSILSCSFLSSGYTNAYNQFVPKNEKYRFKNKKGGLLIPQLDTVNIYRLIEKYYGEDRLYPNEFLSETDYTKKMYQNSKRYLKFYKNGRCLSFSISSKDSLGNENFLTNENLNPNSDYYGKDYYFSDASNSLYKESFVYGQGDGMYLIFKYLISENGNIIEKKSGKNYSIYEKEILPSTWTKYSIDW